MALINWENMSPEVHGTILLALGALLLMYSLNIFRPWMNLILIALALVLIAYGLIETKLLKKITKMLKK